MSDNDTAATRDMVLPSRGKFVLPLPDLRGRELEIGRTALDLCCMATEKLTVTVQGGSIRKLDRWVREGRYANRSLAAQAALDLLDRRNALPTLEWALAHPNPLTPVQQRAWEAELEASDPTLDALEPSLPEA